MKRLTLLAVATLLLASCGENIEEKASARLDLARQAFESGNYGESKILIDSVRTLYPKAFKARKECILLMQQVELNEQLQSVIYLTDMLQEKEEAFNAIKDKFILEKDEEYQDVGNYFYPTQIVEKNMHRSFLRFQVNEKGEMLMTSIYCGSKPIHHLAVKVSAPDGSFAETPASNDSYETTDLDEKIEKADYKLGQDGNVMGFIYLNNEKNIKVEYLGERKYATTLMPNDKKALVELYELSQILSSIENIKKEMQEAERKIEFVKRKIEEGEKKEH